MKTNILQNELNAAPDLKISCRVCELATIFDAQRTACEIDG